MDFVTCIVFLSIILSTLLMVVGPLMELKGIVLFEKNRNPQRTSGRYGMGLMVVGAVLFLGGCVARQWLTARAVTPVVMAGYALWFAGGFVAVIRNEVIKALSDETKGR